MVRDKLSEALGIECTVVIDYSECILFDPITNREEALKRNAEIVECDKCGVKGNRPNMMRWHFENCKVKLRLCKYCDKTIPRQDIKDYLYNQKIYCDRKCYMKSKAGKSPISMTDDIKNKISDKAKSRSSELSERMKNNKVWLKSGRWKTN